MAKDSSYYKSKKQHQIMLLRKILSELPEFVSDFIYDKELSSQPSTLISYSRDIRTFLTYLKTYNPAYKNVELKQFKLSDIEYLNSHDIIEYQHFLEYSEDDADGKSHSNEKKAISRKLSALRGLYKYHLEHHNIENNPTQLVKMPKIKKDKNIVRMNNQEVIDIINAVKYGNEQMSQHQRKILAKTQQRDLAIVTLMLGTGIRVSECAGLDKKDVDLRGGTITIVRKGGSQDILYIGDQIIQVLNEYINGERSRVIPQDGHEDALFYSMQFKRISVDAIERLVKKYAAFVVKNKKITPHKLRSTYGTALYRETGDIRLVADVLGHENINTTIDYYAAIEDEHKRRAANAVDYKRNH
ncbi:tyrosine-type recombinase/integrase [Eubacterium oxidoreducens]|uniref:Site-specific recombinase XerD n=1 Tax=Eubacterium oxidoreducens TaxID=1732 RepID=A0A1G6ALT0_EUBOX|nr:tyrosine-type recombinase/integrase [Eubacterium oxidoreducens]SDB09310.1 Site-specific recombinase XerD [Eubacterium oxidoreducens]